MTHIDAAREARLEIDAEFRVRANDYGLDDLSTHVEPKLHENWSRCRSSAVVAHAVGLSVAVGWSWLQAANPWLGACSGALIYGILACGLAAGVSASHLGPAFNQRFNVLFLPPLAICIVSSAVILMERFAAPELADVLVEWDSLAWISLELSALFLGSVASVGIERNGWSRRLTRDRQRLTDEITALTHRLEALLRSVATDPNEQASTPASPEAPQHVAAAYTGGERRTRDRRTVAPTPMPVTQVHDRHDGHRAASSRPVDSSSAPPIGVVVFLCLLVSTAAWAQGTCGATVALDRTGSVVNQARVERQLVTALSAGLASVTPEGETGCFGLIVFASGDPFAATREEIRVRRSAGPYLAEARTRRFRRDVEDRLRRLLSEPVTPATCSSVPDMLTRVVNERPGLLVTDGDHDCGPLQPTRLSAGTQTTAVVLVRSQRDAAIRNSTDAFDRRRRQILRFVPSATVLPEFELDKAIALIFSRNGGTQ